jgi:hypothetical protein
VPTTSTSRISTTDPHQAAADLLVSANLDYRLAILGAQAARGRAEANMSELEHEFDQLTHVSYRHQNLREQSACVKVIGHWKATADILAEWQATDPANNESIGIYAD